MHPGTTQPTARTTIGYRAVQQDTTATCVDWQVFHSWTPDDPDFTGTVTVVNASNAQLASTAWASATDTAADQALHRAGWRRAGPWHPDRNGCRTAPVTEAALGVTTQRPALPGEHGAAV